MAACSVHSAPPVQQPGLTGGAGGQTAAAGPARPTADGTGGAAPGATATTTPAGSTSPAANAGNVADAPWTPPPPVETGDPAAANGQGWSIVTTVPEGITAADLGRPLDSSFQLLPGTGPVFQPKAPERYPGFRHSVAIVQDQLTLNATVRAWNTSIDANANRRFASYRAEQIMEVRGVQDMAAPRPAPASASFYISKVFYGRSYEVRLSGDTKQFHLGVAGAFLSGRIEGNLKAFAERNRLEFTAIGRGLRPKKDTAIYAKSPSEIEENYTSDGEITVPVGIEYRLIPGRRLPKAEPIAWRKPMRYRLELTAVEARGEACDPGGHCDMSVAILPIGASAKTPPTPTRGPDDTDRWDLRYLVAETAAESELEHGFEIEVWDRDLARNDVLGRCQVRVDQMRVNVAATSPEHKKRWHELCGKSQLLLTLSAEETE